jgi:hypothetical protein
MTETPVENARTNLVKEALHRRVEETLANNRFQVMFNNNFSHYPKEAKELVNSIDNQQLKETILRADFSQADLFFVEIDKETERIKSYCDQRQEETNGIARRLALTVKEDKENNVEAWIVVNLVYPEGKKPYESTEKPKPRVETIISARNTNPEIPQDEEGYCLDCQGLGCWGCNFSGGR